MAETFYAKVLHDFNWEALVREAKSLPCGDCGCASEIKHGNTPIHTVLLGSWMNISPSGKYYEPWACSNVTKAEMDQDAAFNRALEAAAQKYDGFIMASEGDPTDVLFGVECPQAEKLGAVVKLIDALEPATV